MRIFQGVRGNIVDFIRTLALLFRVNIEIQAKVRKDIEYGQIIANDRESVA